jgi:hypothetical protein
LPKRTKFTLGGRTSLSASIFYSFAVRNKTRFNATAVKCVSNYVKY